MDSSQRWFGYLEVGGSQTDVSPKRGFSGEKSFTIAERQVRRAPAREVLPGSTPAPCRRCLLRLRPQSKRPPYRAAVVEGAGAACGKQEKGLRRASAGLVGKYTACSKASRAHPAGFGIPSKLRIFPHLRPGGNECRWARFVGNVLVQTIAEKTVWARNSFKMSRFGQDFDPCPHFGLG
jgi:hypothetical protein